MLRISDSWYKPQNDYVKELQILKYTNRYQKHDVSVIKIIEKVQEICSRFLATK